MTETLLSGHYDWNLVALSIAIAICASYTALDLAGRITNSRGANRGFWLLGGSTSLGLGIWAMHYIGMLAYRLPVVVLYNIPLVALSLFAAIAASAVALFVVSRKKLTFLNLVLGSFAMGTGIATMHYTGMGAMRLNAHATYNLVLLVLSIVLAVAVSWVALYLAFHLRDQEKNPNRLTSAVAMGFAIASMHYTGMAAVCFHHSGSASMSMPASTLAIGVDRLGIIGITSLTFGILALSIISSIADRSFSLQRQMLDAERERWELVINSNQDGLFDTDLVTGRTFYSPRWMAMLGYAPDELPKHIDTWRRLIHPDDRETVLANVERYFQSHHGALEIEYRKVHKDGSARWILSRSQAVWDASGRAIRIVGSHSDITERKQVLAALKVSEARFTSFMENSPSPAFIKDDEGHWLYANAAFERILQQKPGECIGRLDQDFLPPAMAKRIRKMDLALLASGGHMTETLEMLWPGGALRQVLRTTFCFTEASGRRAIGGLMLDISERIHSEERLLASQIKYRELFERNPLPSKIYAIATGQILAVNQAAIDHYGWTQEEFLRLKVENLRIPGECDAVETELQQCSPMSRATKPLQHRRKDRSNIWVELSSQEIDFEGTPARLVMANDVTAHVELESSTRQAHEQLEYLVAQRTAELESSTAKWHGLIEALPQFVWSTTVQGTCDYMSQAWADYTGVPQPQLLGLGWLATLHPQDQQHVEDSRLNAREMVQAYDLEYRIRSKEGLYRWFVARSRPVFAVGGELTHWIGTSTDIDDQKRSEELLERAVAERTIELARARDHAERAVQAKSDFLATMSHEIRTPMNGVIGMAHLLMHTDLTADQKFFLDTIHSSGQALLAIINDILDFSKIEAGHMKLESTGFNLRSLLEEVVRLIAPAAAAKDLQLTYTLAHSLPPDVSGDPGRLRQILLNLLSNAVKFTSSGSVALTVSPPSRACSETALRFEVLDTGIGISPEQQLGLFKAFHQGDNSTTRRFGGTGLGLTIAKRLVELMGGTIGVSSRLGEGATFWFDVCLPAAEVPPPPQCNQSNGDLGFDGRAALILVADDVVTNQQVALGILDTFGMRGHAVASGSEAIYALESIPYDLVIMDVHMPEMDGLEATRRIRMAELSNSHSPDKRHVPIIAVTASVLPDDRRKCLEAGMDDYLIKPVAVDALAAVLRKWLPAEAPGPASVTPNTSGADVSQDVVQSSAIDDSGDFREQPAFRVFDLPALLKRLRGNRQLADTILDGFVEEMPMQINALIDVVHSGRAQAIEQQAHKIKGASANVNGSDLSLLAAQIERAAKAGEVESARAHLAEIEVSFIKLKEAIRSRPKGVTNPT